jgi:phosphoenolpyruvate synthase/pyruvate phosphate dikinase
MIGSGRRSLRRCCRRGGGTSCRSSPRWTDRLPTTIRLLDPPLHEFLPDITELSVRVVLAEARGEKNESDLRLMQAVHSLHEQNPMLGLPGSAAGLGRARGHSTCRYG